MTTASEAVERSLAAIAADDEPGIFIELIDPMLLRRAAAEVDAAVARGDHLPLAGQTVAVKGNIDVAGHRTTAGCPTYGDVAARSATAVRALEAAGAVVVGITNLDQFATGLVGTRSPHGICPNAFWPEYVSGGSSSGSAVAVARGLVDFSLGTDTAGSGRVPAAANGIVGLKPTRGRISAAGVVPACQSIDCVSVFATSVNAAATVASLAAGFDADDPWSRKAPSERTIPSSARNSSHRTRVGVPNGIDVPGLDQLLAATDGQAVAIDLDPFLAAGALLYEGAFVAERYAGVGAFVEAHADQCDPVVREIILAAGRIPAWQFARDVNELTRLRQATLPIWNDVDMIAVPTVPRIPTVAEVIAEPLVRNAELGTYTNFVNLLDLCAVAVPVVTDKVDSPPPSITVIAPAWHDDLLAAALTSWPTGTPAIRRTT